MKSQFLNGLHVSVPARLAVRKHSDAKGTPIKVLLHLSEAIRLEPDYAAAHGFIAWCHEQRYLRAGLQPAGSAMPP